MLGIATFPVNVASFVLSIVSASANAFCATARVSVCVPEPALPATMAVPPAVAATVMAVDVEPASTKYVVLIAKLVGSAPVVVNATAVPAVEGKPVPLIVAEPFVNVTVNVAVDPAGATWKMMLPPAPEPTPCDPVIVKG